LRSGENGKDGGIGFDEVEFADGIFAVAKDCEERQDQGECGLLWF